MGIITTLVAARWLARRAERRRARLARGHAGADGHAWPGGTPVQTVWPCRSCGQPLILSINWPGIDPHWWEDSLGGECVECYRVDDTQAR